MKKVLVKKMIEGNTRRKGKLLAFTVTVAFSKIIVIIYNLIFFSFT